MGKKLVTDAGKNELLRLCFASGSKGPFNWMALGGESSKGAQGGKFVEISEKGYHRVETKPGTPTNKEIVISATFEENNNAEGKIISEIGLCNSSNHTTEETFFLYSEVPEIPKESNISLKYTVIISME